VYYQGSVELRVPMCAWKLDLPPNDGVWSCAATSGVGDQAC
jgi:hypothetical protein